MSSSAAASSPQRAWPPTGRRSAARRCPGSSGTPSGGDARPSRRSARARGGAAARGAGVEWRRSRPLADLPADVLALVADALALVRLGWPHLADLGGDLADLLLVDALDDDLGRRRYLVGDAGRRVLDHRVGEADVELQRSPAQRCAVADALDLQLLLEALGHALDHVRHERPCEPVQGAVLAAIGRP